MYSSLGQVQDINTISHSEVEHTYLLFCHLCYYNPARMPERSEIAAKAEISKISTTRHIKGFASDGEVYLELYNKPIGENETAESFLNEHRTLAWAEVYEVATGEIKIGGSSAQFKTQPYNAIKYYPDAVLMSAEEVKAAGVKLMGRKAAQYAVVQGREYFRFDPKTDCIVQRSPWQGPL